MAQILRNFIKIRFCQKSDLRGGKPVRDMIIKPCALNHTMCDNYH